MKKIFRYIIFYVILCVNIGAVDVKAENGSSLVSVQLSQNTFELLGHRIQWPKVEMNDDQTLSSELNQKITDALGVSDLLNQVTINLTSERKITSNGYAFFEGDFLSCIQVSSLPMSVSQWKTVIHGCVFNPSTGEKVLLRQLFKSSREYDAFSEYIDTEIASTLSAHLNAAELKPLPEEYLFLPGNLLLIYPDNRFMLLNGQPGTIAVSWHEIYQFLDPQIIRQLNLEQWLTLSDTTAKLISDTINQGILPGIPVSLEQEINDAIMDYGIASDPDLYESGRYVSLEQGVFRDVYLMTDGMSEKSFDHSVIQGIRADRISFYGLCTDRTTITEWREMLGTPDHSIHLSEDQAESWRLVPGISDYYSRGEHKLRLHADENGVLQSVFLLP